MPQAESIKVGISKLLSYPAVPIAIERGYFKEQGIDASMEYFDSAQPIAVAVASGSVDFGVSGLSAAFYTLAGQGQLRMIAASGYEEPGFYNIVLLGSLKSYAAGLTSPKNLAGHSVAVTQLGTSLELNLGRLADKFGVDFKSLEIKPLQSNTNVISALTGGTVDAGVIPASPALTLIAKNEVKVLSWVGDDAPGNTGGAYTGTKTANDRGDPDEALPCRLSPRDEGSTKPSPKPTASARTRPARRRCSISWRNSPAPRRRSRRRRPMSIPKAASTCPRSRARSPGTPRKGRSRARSMPTS